jgi:iron complex transport system ATP-binding protein
VHIQVDDLSVSYASQIVLSGLNLHLSAGRITVLVGSNGSGKSTMLKAIARIVKPVRGAIYLDGKAIHELPTKEVARQMSILPQNPVTPEGLTVRELVSFGRLPHQTYLRRESGQDHEAIDRAIELTGVQQFAGRRLDELSGGQRQRAWIALAIAQETSTILLDEPTTFLDLEHQFEILNLLASLNRRERRTIVMVLHDLNHAARFADHLVVVESGRVNREGKPADVLTAQLLREVFRIRADVMTCPHTGVPVCLPYGLSEKAGIDP